MLTAPRRRSRRQKEQMLVRVSFVSWVLLGASRLQVCREKRVWFTQMGEEQEGNQGSFSLGLNQGPSRGGCKVFLNPVCASEKSASILSSDSSRLYLKVCWWLSLTLI